MTPLRRAAEAMEDSAMRLAGHDLGTIYRDRIAEDSVQALLRLEELSKVVFRELYPTLDWDDSNLVAERRVAMQAAGAVIEHLLQGAPQ